jgi:hypothetical protein
MLGLILGAGLGALALLSVVAFLLVFVLRRSHKDWSDDLGDYPIETELAEERCDDDSEELGTADGGENFSSLSQSDFAVDFGDDTEEGCEWPGFD